MAKKSLRENIRYSFDSIMSKGTFSLIGFLAIIISILVVIFTIVTWLIDLIPGQSIGELFWVNIFQIVGAWTLPNAVPGHINFLISFLIGLTSIFVTSILIGLIATGINQKVQSLREGRSKVKESGHTIILGWSEVVYTIIESLMEANRNQRRCKIVIMGNKDKVEMEGAISEKLKISRNTRIICRKGYPVNINDLKIVNLSESKSIIIVEDTDSKVLKTILAINNSKKGLRSIPYNIVAVLRDGKNTDSGKIAGEGQASFILNSCFIARLIAHTCYQPGLSLVYNELLKFKGNEIYARNFRELAGRSFSEAKFMFENSSLIGIKDGNTVRLNPAGDTLIRDNDEMVLICSDDVAIIPSKKEKYDINQEAINISEKKEDEMEKILILGWNRKAKMIIDELIKYVSPKTQITIVAETSPHAEFEEHEKEEEVIIIGGVRIHFIHGDINDHDLLTRLSGEGFNHVVVLAYTSKETQEADCITLMTLIHLRDIAEKNDLDFSITSEMLDISNRDLVKVAKVNDFIISEKLTSLLLTQISENRLLDPIFEDLLCESGSEIYLKKVRDFIRIDEPVDFYTVLEAAGQKNDLAIGYKIN
ncbi:hypothetical protein ACFLQQ_02860, partial [Actinomycetota bacterium]